MRKMMTEKTQMREQILKLESREMRMSEKLKMSQMMEKMEKR